MRGLLDDADVCVAAVAEAVDVGITCSPTLLSTACHNEVILV